MKPQVGDKLFCYGTLLRGAKNFRILEGRVEFVSDALLEDASIYNLGWFPGLKYRVGGTVRGQLLEFKDKDLPEVLDRYEGYPHLYDRQKVKTSHGEAFKERSSAWVYIFNGDVRDEQIIPGGDWLTYLESKKAA